MPKAHTEEYAVKKIVTNFYQQPLTLLTPPGDLTIPGMVNPAQSIPAKREGKKRGSSAQYHCRSEENTKKVGSGNSPL